MRFLTLIFLVSLVSTLVDVRPVRACGGIPYAEDAEDRAGATRALMTGSRLPLLSSSWHSEYWVLAWARMEGVQFDAASVASLTENPTWLRIDRSIRPAIERWTAARAAAGAQGIGRLQAHRPGPGYTQVLTCGPDMFLTAVQTLADRVDAGSSGAAIATWIEGQDAVFARCTEPEAELPGELGASASGIAHDDRAYQRAQALALGLDANAAIAAFEAIAVSGSTWADLALYRAAHLRVRGGSTDVADLRRRLGRVQDAKAARALRQLIDRVDLFPGAPADVVDALSRRLKTESLGGDLPRTLRDIVHFAKRVDGDRACVSGLVSMITGRPACSGEAHILGRLRQDIEHERPLPLRGRLLELNRHFHEGRLALLAGRAGNARRAGARMLRLAGDSSASTRNAAHALSLAGSTRVQNLAHVMRESAQGPRMHRDGAQGLARASTATWRRVIRELPEVYAGRMRADGVLRATILDSDRDIDFFATQMAENTPGSDGIEEAVNLALSGPQSTRRVRLVLALVQHDAGQFTVSDELNAHWGSLAEQGCRIGHCGDAHPNETAVSMLPSTVRYQVSRDRERIEAAGSRLDALGEWALGWAAAHEGAEPTGELLHRVVRATRRASLHGGMTERTGLISRRAFAFLHERMGDSTWASQTPYWFR